MNSLMNGGDCEQNYTRFVDSNVTECPRMLFSLDLLTCEQQVTAFFFTGGNRTNQVGGSGDSYRIQRFGDWKVRS